MMSRANAAVPQAVDDVLGLPKVDFIQCGADLILHILEKQYECIITASSILLFDS